MASKKPSPKPIKHVKIIAIAAAVILVLVLVACIYPMKKWFTTNYYRIKVQNTVKKQLDPLKPSLVALGFGDMHTLQTDCGNVTYGPVDDVGGQVPGGTYFSCSSGIDRYIHTPTDALGKAEFNQNAVQLDKVLRANGWKSRPDLLTVPWFKKISEGIDYQPDQYNEKKVGDMTCTVDFFTAFSTQYHEKPAISVRVFCVKDNPGEQPPTLD